MSKLQNFDLEERTAKFGESIILFARSMKQDTISRPLISQIVRSSTSIGANYMEADGADSKKDFVYKIALCKKESKETKHWLRMLATTFPERKTEIQTFWKEAQELTLIFSAIIKTSKEK